MDTLSAREDIANSQPNKRLKNYITGSESKMQDTTNSFALHDLKEPTPALPIKNKKIIRSNSVKVESVIQPPIEETISARSAQPPKKFDQSISSVENPLKPQYSSVMISKVKKSLNTSQTSKDDDLNKSATLHHEENEFSSTSMSKIHMMKIPKNKVSASPKIRSNTSSEPADIQASKRGTDTINSNAKPDNVHTPKAQHSSSPKAKDIRSPGQLRAKIFNHVAVSKVKPTDK